MSTRERTQVPQINWIEDKRLIMGDNNFYDLNCHNTQLNNNVLVIGSSGAGKTRSVVSPNLLQATGSYIVSDPKGNLYKKYKAYFEERGYKVKKLDFIHPEESVKYNPFHYIRTEADISKIANMLMIQDEHGVSKTEPFWELSACALVETLASYLFTYEPYENHNIHNILRLAAMGQMSENQSFTKLDRLFCNIEKFDPESYAVSHYKLFRIGAQKSVQSILMTLTNKLARYDSPALIELMSDDELEIVKIGQEKTILFVITSDTDRQYDNIANLFFLQAINELCSYADECCENEELPVPVRFILDDFATNVKITEMPRMISSFRSRNISVMMMLQSEAQLKYMYGENAATVIGNCDTYMYMGGDDIGTAKVIAQKIDVPLSKILYMPVGHSYVFRRGEKPKMVKNFDLEGYDKFRGEFENGVKVPEI